MYLCMYPRTVLVQANAHAADLRLRGRETWVANMVRTPSVCSSVVFVWLGMLAGWAEVMRSDSG